MDFYKRVELVCSRIPYGCAATYGQIALLCGKPKNARQVGYALSHMTGHELPAHRVVGAGGYLSGAGAFPAPDTQSRFMEGEGMEVTDEERGRQRVNLKRYGWHHTMEDALWFYEEFKNRGI